MSVTNAELYARSVAIFKKYEGEKTASSDTEDALKLEFGLKLVNSKLARGVKDYHNLPDRGAMVKQYVDELFDNPIPEDVTGYRDVFYTFKHKIQKYQYPTQDAEKFSNAITDEVSDAIWDRFVAGHSTVYQDIRMQPERVEAGRLPIVCFLEKSKRDFDTISNTIPISKYVASGTSNKFELAMLAEEITAGDTLFNTSYYDGKVYLFSVTDYDPSGLTIKQSLYDNFLLCLRVFEPDVELIHIPIDYSSLVGIYDNYRLSQHEAEREIWNDNGLYGMELNVIPLEVRMKLLVEAMDSTIPKELYEVLAKQRRMAITKGQILWNDPKYQKLEKKLRERSKKLLKDAGDIDNYDFDPERVDNLIADANLEDFSKYKY